jgi:hypothetical protein
MPPKKEEGPANINPFWLPDETPKKEAPPTDTNPFFRPDKTPKKEAPPTNTNPSFLPGKTPKKQDWIPPAVAHRSQQPRPVISEEPEPGTSAWEAWVVTTYRYRHVPRNHRLERTSDGGTRIVRNYGPDGKDLYTDPEKFIRDLQRWDPHEGELDG